MSKILEPPHLEINEKQLGPEHPDTASSLNDLASVYRKIGDYPKALPLLERALAINEKQLGRIEGNFLLAGWCSSIRMEDKASLRPMIVEHQHLFGKGVLKSLGTDKGYYSEANRRYLRWLEGLEEFCLPQPGSD